MRQKQSLGEWYQEELAKAKTADDRRAVEAQFHYELAVETGEREAAFTSTLLKDAHRLHVPVPYDEDSWDRDPEGNRYLTHSGVAKLRESIRAEEKWHMERRNHLVVWVAALTGLVGAVTGLLAILASV